MTQPLASVIAPSSFPLRFFEVVNTRGDFGSDVVNPKGVTYQAVNNAGQVVNQLIITISPFTQSPQIIQTLNISQYLDQSSVPAGIGVNQAFNFYYGLRAQFGTLQLSRSMESKPAAVPAAGQPVSAGFTPGDVFVPVAADQIARLNSSGAVVTNPFVDFAQGDAGLWGGVTFDLNGLGFGGNLVVMTLNGVLFTVSHTGVKTQIVDIKTWFGDRHPEGLDIAPSGFGSFTGQAIFGLEGVNDSDPYAGGIYAVSNAGGQPQLIANIGSVETLNFVPPNGGTYYQTQTDFHGQRLNRILTVSHSQFLGRLGHLIAVNELSGEFWDIAWNGSAFTQSYIGRAPGPWTSGGIGLTSGNDGIQGTELEGGCFAALAPALPNWGGWALVPGGFTTNVPASITQNNDGNMHLACRAEGGSYVAGHVYRNTWSGASWSGWVEAAPGGMVTSLQPAISTVEKILNVFAVNTAGAVMYTRPLAASPAWVEVAPAGGMVTSLPVSACNINGRLCVCARKASDGQLYINEFAVIGGQQAGGVAQIGGTWNGWSPVPNSAQFSTQPTIASFQNELFVFAVSGAGAVMVTARTADGDWTDWSSLPGAFATGSPVAAVGAPDGQFYVVARGSDSSPHQNVASQTGTWSQWQLLPSPGTSDQGYAIGAQQGSVYLIAKGGGDHAIYFRHS